jgi:hypothetical protein
MTPGRVRICVVIATNEGGAFCVADEISATASAGATHRTSSMSPGAASAPPAGVAA